MQLKSAGKKRKTFLLHALEPATQISTTIVHSGFGRSAALGPEPQAGAIGGFSPLVSGSSDGGPTAPQVPAIAGCAAGY